MFRFIEGTDHKMIVTSDGRVFKRKAIYKGNQITGRHLIGWTEFREVNLSNNDSGYLWVNVGRIRNTVPVHRLVAEAFLPNPLGLRDVDHINGNKLDNRVENLRWVTQKENNNNPNTRCKIAYSGKRKVLSNIQGFNPMTNHRTPVFKSLKETLTWVTPEGKKINPRSLFFKLNKKTTYRNYLWTGKLVTGEECQKILS